MSEADADYADAVLLEELGGEGDELEDPGRGGEGVVFCRLISVIVLRWAYGWGI